jgi:hypothetical protein
MTYFGLTVPPGPVQADLNADGAILGVDFFIVLGEMGTVTDCQTKPITFNGDPRLSITMLSATTPRAVPGACFDVSAAAQPQTTLFTVCDNNFQGSPELDPLCTPDGVCDDEKTGDGLIRVELAPGDYSVAESKAPMNHTPDPNKKACSAVPGAKCGLTFLNEVIDAPTPWFPWDTNGDNAVSGLDFFEVLAHFNEEKP